MTRKKSGFQLFSLFVLLCAGIFMLASSLFLHDQAKKTTEIITEEVLGIQLTTVERYLSELINAHDEAAKRMAKHPAVVSAMLAGANDPDHLADILLKLKSPNVPTQINLYNFAGGLEYAEIPNNDRMLEHVNAMRSNEAFFISTQYSFYRDAHSEYLVITTPLLYNGYEEGVLVYQARLRSDQQLSNLAQSDHHWFGIKQARFGWEPNLPVGWDWQEKPLAQYDISLKYASSPNFHQQTENALMWRLFLGVFFATLVTVAVVYLLGQRVLVSPYQALYQSEQTLEKQAKVLRAQAAELKAREAESNRLARVVKNMRDAVVFTNAQIEITWVNNSFEKMTGYSLEDVRGRKPTLLQGPETDPKVKQAISQCIDAREHGLFELINYSSSGQKYWLELALTPLYARNGQHEGFMAVERDITERKDLQARLARIAKEAQSANLAKSRFLASMSHELRTPMNGILGVGEILANSALNREQRELVETLVGSGKHMLSVLNDILDFSKVEAGKLEVHPVAFALTDLAVRLRSIYKTLCDEKGLEFTLSIEAPSDLLCVADETRIMQMLQNLLNNAWKFTQQGHIEANIRLVSEQGRYALDITVTDSGIGIDNTKLATIFEPFSQAESETTRRFGGSGLGLAIVYELAKIMQGDISVESQIGVGSQFRLHLPVTVQTQQVSSAALTNHKFDGSGLSALIVEDNRVNVIVLKKFLTARQFQVETAENGQVAVDKVKRQSYDLILVDNHMPVMDGYEAVLQIRTLANGQDSVIIGCTADVFEETRVKLLNAGCVDVITKPISGDILDKTLSEHLTSASIPK
ncbi:response regulator [Vibrio sp. SM6]|uniref:histidine kinase n=1 Tax=Vibrio agarilyticus TaxID=2726741 RepID=A0A7X8TNI8_9VIBR|nr:ATP-binding protein [Vibrio agarilyticus]NLS12021.1 response regulator [Vibrio agarilyticus]